MLGVFSVVTLAATIVAAADATEAPARPRIDEAGVTHVPAFELPPSDFSSAEARAMMARRSKAPAAPSVMDPDVGRSRLNLAAMLKPQVDAMLKAYPVDVAEEMIAGVPVRIVTPKGAAPDKKRVLINLHGGAFQTCWESCSILESAPIASVGGYNVVSVNYRMAPESKHPAGVEDVEKVYRALLKTHKAKSIGVYGCSAGGALTGQAAAWLPEKGLPQPGAIGLFGAGAVRFMKGDSAYVAAYIDGSFPPPPKPGAPEFDMTRGYFAGVDMNDRIVSPALHADVLAKFPPTLLVTGTRAMDLSPAVVTNSALIKAGVSSTLIVGEAMGHCYIYLANLPEARDAHAAIVAFFKKNLE